MKKVFIGGSRRVTRLSTEVRKRLHQIIDRQLPVLIGDANGADKAVQQYLQNRGYGSVEVFCVGENCRNNLGHWKIRAIVPPPEGREVLLTMGPKTKRWPRRHPSASCFGMARAWEPWLISSDS